MYGGRDAVAGAEAGAVDERSLSRDHNYRQAARAITALRTRGELVKTIYVRARFAPLRGRLHRRGSSYNGFSFWLAIESALFRLESRQRHQSRDTGVHGSATICWTSRAESRERNVLVCGLLSSRRRPGCHLYEYLADRTMAPDHLLPSTGWIYNASASSQRLLSQTAVRVRAPRR